ncbi:hypothetical protein E2C01_102738 [Portunus trituberculatus]|uniref:Uncharacterized protein n=1 Tax=Portunus trituberculatus TaxID=210409 RepID=A0A5B7KPT7_PORTR|nr:hypothetical protein [Portunus trituberculatus]
MGGAALSDKLARPTLSKRHPITSFFLERLCRRFEMECAERVIEVSPSEWRRGRRQGGRGRLVLSMNFARD